MLCDRFLQDYTDFCDGLLDPERAAEFRDHLRGCPGCARYDRVLSRGLDLLRAIPTEEPTDDFLPRLQHRLYNVDEGVSPPVHRLAGGAALVGVAAVGILALFWLPFAATVPLELDLEPVAAHAPDLDGSDLPSLFQAGPFFNTGTTAAPAVLDVADLAWRPSLRVTAMRSSLTGLRLAPPPPSDR